MSKARQDGTDTIELNWKGNINIEPSLPPIRWEAVIDYAKDVKRSYTKHDSNIDCQLSMQYSMGGLHVVRRLDFEDGTSWVARLQRRKVTAESCKRLVTEVHTIQIVRERSNIPVPEVFGYNVSYDSPAGVPFMLLEYIPADTVMDSFGGYELHKGRIPPIFREDYYASMANIQIEMASVRFSMIGSIVKLSDGTYSVGELPDIGGPFRTANDFFCAWARNSKFPYDEAFIRARTPETVVDDIITSIQDFPAKLLKFAQHHIFRDGPFPLMHTDLRSSNVLVDSECRIKGVIDWENAIVGPWEMLEFIKDLCIVPHQMDGPLYCKNEWDQEVLDERKKYVQVIKRQEARRQLDQRVSETLEDDSTQDLAQAVWLYSEGKIGFYTSLLGPSLVE
ncbi:Protein kinase-like domain protein [Pyrenophora tritici-repentis]|nr:Protein kinase-like domain protein [Pyrenophora tritici-repentis]